MRDGIINKYCHNDVIFSYMKWIFQKSCETIGLKCIMFTFFANTKKKKAVFLCLRIIEENRVTAITACPKIAWENPTK